MNFDTWLRRQRADREASGLQRRLVPRPPRWGVVDVAGNDYLGLSRDVRVIGAAREALAIWGAGAGASRLVTGALTLHTDLETELAAFLGRPAGLLFSTGYHANLAVVTALADPETLIVSDAHIHASLIDGCRLSRCARLAIVPHNDVEAVEAALAGRREPRALVLCESVYSVLGDAAPLAALGEVTARNGAVLVVDEAHAIGVSGDGGRGLVALSGLAGRTDVVVTLTLSKALASQGGAVVASADVIDQLVNTARPFIFDTGLAPAATAAALAALGVVVAEPRRSGRARAIACQIATVLGVSPPAAAVVSAPMAGPTEALQAQADFADGGFRVGCFRPPSVPDGISRLRLTAHATMTDDDVTRLCARLLRVPSVR